MGAMSVNSGPGPADGHPRGGPAPEPPSGVAPPSDGIRGRVQAVTARQQRFERYLAAELGLDRPGLEAMDHLISAGPATPTELARRLEISTAAMSLVLNRLEAAGHVARDRHPSDRRKLVVTASDESARQAYARVRPLIDGVEAVIDAMAPADRTVVADFLERLVAVYDEVTPPAAGRRG